MSLSHGTVACGVHPKRKLPAPDRAGPGVDASAIPGRPGAQGVLPQRLLPRAAEDAGTHARDLARATEEPSADPLTAGEPSCNCWSVKGTGRGLGPGGWARVVEGSP